MIRRATVLSAAVTAALALPTAVVFAGGGAAAAPVVSSALPAVAAIDISVTGVGVATYPAFDPSVSRYAITTGPTTGGAVTVDVSADAGAAVLINGWPSAGPTDVADLEPGDEVSVIVQDGAESAAYAFVFLPEEFPRLEASVTTPGISEGLVGLTLTKFSNGGPRFETVVDSEGVPAHVFQAPDNTIDFKRQPNGSYTSSRTTTTPDRTGSAVVELDETFTETARHETVGLVDTDDHDSILLPDGTVFLVAYEPNADTGLVDSVIQEISSTGEVVLEWNSGEAGLAAETVTPDNPDYAHINSIALMADGDILASLRHTSSVLKIARRSHDGFAKGDIVWRLGGRRSDFTFTNDLAVPGPCAQHTASELPNGNIQIYDNGSGFISDKMCVDPTDPDGAPVSRVATRVTEYDLGSVDTDPTTPETADLVWSYETGAAGFFAGSAIRRTNGNTLLGFAGVRGEVAREITGDGTTVWELRDPAPEGEATYATYRATPFPAATDLDAIDPEAAVVIPRVGDAYQAGQQVYAAATCTDIGGSTLQSCSGSGELLDTSSPGTKEFVTTAVDGAGNATTVSRTYEVLGSYFHTATLKIPGGPQVRRLLRKLPDRAGSVKTVLKIANEGNAADSYVVEALPRKKGFVTKFYADGTNVTGQVRRGTYATPSVAPGRSGKLVLKVKRLRRVDNGDRWTQRILTTSSAQPQLKRRALHKLKATRRATR